jgi:branched-chain amino acid transport system permease protein
MTGGARAFWSIAAVGIVSLCAMPLLDNYVLRLVTLAFMYAGLSLSWNLTGGYAGYPSFATSAFFGLGAYVSGITQHQGVVWVGAWLLSLIATGAFAALLGSVILRLRGHYFAVGSLVIVEVLREVITTSTSFTGGGMGLNLPVISHDPTAFGRIYFCAMLLVLLLTLLTTLWVDRSKMGVALRCIKQNEDAAVVVGINTTGYKVLAFTLSGAIAGAIGAVYGSWVSYIDPSDAFDILISVKPIIMTLLGGPGTVVGPLFGSALFLLFEETVWRNFMTLHEGMLGLIVVALILCVPSGLTVSLPDIFARQAARLRVWGASE